MKPGTRPKPTALKVLEGNPGRRPLNKSEPSYPSKLLPPPRHLDGRAKAEWWRFGGLLLEQGLVTEIDRGLLAAYCQSWSRWVHAETQIRKYGLVVLSTSKGFPVQSPYLGIANRAMEQMCKIALEFGASPSSRSRLVAPAKQPVEEDPLEQLRMRRAE